MLLGRIYLSVRRWELEENTLWRVKKVKKQKQVLDDTKVEVARTWDENFSSRPAVLDTSDCNALEFDPTQPKRKLPPTVQTRAQKWACLFNTIYTDMRMSYEELFPHCSAMYPFEPADIKCPHRQWSSKFCNSPIPDATNIQKPNVVLLDRDVELTGWAHVLTCVEITGSDLGAKHDIPLYKGVITKGYLMMQEQPWCRFVILFSISANNLRAHYIDRSGLTITRPISIAKSPTRLVDMLNTMSLANSKYHGMDPTMHMCNQSCKKSPCDVGDKAIGWIEDAQKQKLSIISVLWRSQGLFSRRNDLLSPHKEMVTKNVLHGDLSPNNLIIHEGQGYFINFDHAQIIMQGNTSVRSHGTGTVPYMSIHLLYAITAERAQGCGNVMVKRTASDDLESLFYIFVNFIATFDGPKGTLKKAQRWGEVIKGMGATAAPYKSGLVLVPWHNKELMNCTTSYFGGVRELIQAWHHKFLDAHADQTCAGVTHEEIEDILNAWISHEAVDESLPLEKLH
ncbi:hypothetical protein DFH29DRAFT_1007207 [Suillus ampliporus]|nr:hypothetical protein DFH29DRAFT_1007207 [Suillus ampliporus]